MEMDSMFITKKSGGQAVTDNSFICKQQKIG